MLAVSRTFLSYTLLVLYLPNHYCHLNNIRYLRAIGDAKIVLKAKTP